mgnify:FL=1|jgi:hypothetical protein
MQFFRTDYLIKNYSKLITDPSNIELSIHLVLERQLFVITVKCCLIFLPVPQRPLLTSDCDNCFDIVIAESFFGGIK